MTTSTLAPYFCDRAQTGIQSPIYVITLLLLMSFLVAGCSSIEDARSPSGSEDLMPVGVAEVDITPDSPIRLSGYGGRREETDEVAQRIWAKALAFGSDADQPAVLVTAEVVGISAELRQEIADRVANQSSLDASHLTITTSHTHAGPQLESHLPNLFSGPIPPGHQKSIASYTETFADKVVRVVLQALENREPAQVGWTKGSVGFAVNRRIVKDGKWQRIGVNPEGPVDHDLPLLRVTDPEGGLRALLLNYACHNTTISGAFNKIHGDWSGLAEKQLEEQYPGTVAMVSIGAAGDINPEPRGDVKYVDEHARAVVEEVNRLLQGSFRPVTVPPRVRMDWIDLPFADVPTRSEWEEMAQLDDVRGYYAQKVLDRLQQGDEVTRAMNYPIQTWTFGENLAMIFLGGEVVVDYSLRLKREFDARRIWVTAYANAVPGYIASADMIPEGGYEVLGSMYYYGQPSRLDTAVEERIIQTVHRLMPDGYTAGN